MERFIFPEALSPSRKPERGGMFFLHFFWAVSVCLAASFAALPFAVRPSATLSVETAGC